MKEKMNLINWLLVLVTAVNIIIHRVWLAQVAAGKVSENIASILQITIYAEMLLFLGTCAGAAVMVWKKVSKDPDSMEKQEEFPKLSFSAAIVAFLVFSLYWMM
jgi:hypothetical protein